MGIVKLNLHDSACLVIDEYFLFWIKTCILIQHRQNCIIKCKKLYENLRTLENHKTRTSELNSIREN